MLYTRKKKLYCHSPTAIVSSPPQSFHSPPPKLSFPPPLPPTTHPLNATALAPKKAPLAPHHPPPSSSSAPFCPSSPVFSWGASWAPRPPQPAWPPPAKKNNLMLSYQPLNACRKKQQIIKTNLHTYLLYFEEDAKHALHLRGELPTLHRLPQLVLIHFFFF